MTMIVAANPATPQVCGSGLRRLRLAPPIGFAQNASQVRAEDRRRHGFVLIGFSTRCGWSRKICSANHAFDMAAFGLARMQGGERRFPALSVVLWLEEGDA